MKFFLWHYKSELIEHIITIFFNNFYLMFLICDEKDFENFLILRMIVIFRSDYTVQEHFSSPCLNLIVIFHGFAK